MQKNTIWQRAQRQKKKNKTLKKIANNTNGKRVGI